VTIRRSDLALPFRPTSARSGGRGRSGELARRAAELTERAAELLGEADVDDLDPENPGGAPEVVSTLTWLCIERLREDPPSPAVSQLRAISTSADLIDRVCEELVHSCLFDRAVLGRVEDGTWTPWVEHFEHPESMEQWLEDWMNTSIPLSDMLLETELVRERRPELIQDTSSERIHPIIREGLSHSYVVAPVMPAGNVVGFFHADHGISGRRCDETDREVLWAFAEGFGHIYERTVLLERLRSQREEVRTVLTSLESAMAALNDAELELAATPDAQSPVTRTAVSVLTTMSGSFEELTPRELEVLELMVAGARNQKIAEQLVITVGTVKSHVKHILRKLGAVNRSQAIAHYLGVLRDADD
jgi:DNA-binding CsgD family transcriptional regulator